MIRTIQLAAATVAFALLAAPAAANEYLWPDTMPHPGNLGPADRYDALMASTFNEAFGRNVRLRRLEQTAMVLGDAEHTVTLEGNGDAYRIVAIHPVQTLMSRAAPGKPAPDVHRCEFQVTRALGDRLVEVWRAMLARTVEVPRRDIGADGSMLHFAVVDAGRETTGVTWSPSKPAAAGWLATVANAMDDVCMKNDPRLLAALNQQIDGLEGRLKSVPKP